MQQSILTGENMKLQASEKMKERWKPGEKKVNGKTKPATGDEYMLHGYEPAKRRS